MANRGAVKKLCIKRRDEQKQLVLPKINNYLLKFRVFKN
jgi:hypothetical protein